MIVIDRDFDVSRNCTFEDESLETLLELRELALELRELAREGRIQLDVSDESNATPDVKKWLTDSCALILKELKAEIGRRLN